MHLKCDGFNDEMIKNKTTKMKREEFVFCRFFFAENRLNQVRLRSSSDNQKMTKVKLVQANYFTHVDGERQFVMFKM